MNWRLEQQVHSLPLRKPFTISTGTSTARPTIIVCLRDAGSRAGFGEATPIHYLGETPESCTRELDGMAAWIEERSAWLESQFLSAPDRDCADVLQEIDLALRSAFAGARSTLAGVNVALHDLMGMRLQRDVGSLLGIPPGPGPESSYTIDIEDLEGRLGQVQEARRLGMRVLKVKLGGGVGPAEDRVLAAIREIHDGPLCVDANGAWNEDEAIRKILSLEQFGLDFVEQPLPRGHHAALGRIRDAVGIPLMADEDSLDMQDLPALAGMVDGINIKLAKCGGLTEALRMVGFARNEGWKVMLGCMIESSVSITAASWLLPLLDHADLDAALLLADDPFRGAVMAEGRLVPPEGPGLGVRPA